MWISGGNCKRTLYTDANIEVNDVSHVGATSITRNSALPAQMVRRFHLQIVRRECNDDGSIPPLMAIHPKLRKAPVVVLLSKYISSQCKLHMRLITLLMSSISRS